MQSKNAGFSGVFHVSCAALYCSGRKKANPQVGFFFACRKITSSRREQRQQQRFQRSCQRPEQRLQPAWHRQPGRQLQRAWRRQPEQQPVQLLRAWLRASPRVCVNAATSRKSRVALRVMTRKHLMRRSSSAVGNPIRARSYHGRSA